MAADAWMWVAHYDDGTSIAELDPYGDHAFAEIDLGRLRAFELRPLHDGVPAVCLLVDPAQGERPVFFRRRASSWLLAGGAPETLCTCIGMERTVGGQTVATYVFLDEQGHVLMADNREAVG